MWEKVNTLLEQYIGGQIFFTELDKAVKFDIKILTQLMGSVYEFYNDRKHRHVLTIASGEIGLAMHNMGISVDFLVPGGLRFDPSKINLEPFADTIEGREFVFVDDSYFSGRTVAVVREEIERLGGHFLGTFVAYDGSKIKEPDVHALYRYYDHHDVLGRPLTLSKEGVAND